MFKEFDIDAIEKFITDCHTSKRQRRKTIKDRYITTEIFIKLVNKCSTLRPTRKEIVSKLMNIGISNNIIAQVINVVIPDAKATSNSVASIVNSIRKENLKVDELLQDIEEL
nr:MAG TPA: hypothetical protein [Caudoviricetes sp.]